MRRKPARCAIRATCQPADSGTAFVQRQARETRVRHASMVLCANCACGPAKARLCAASANRYAAYVRYGAARAAASTRTGVNRAAMLAGVWSYGRQRRNTNAILRKQGEKMWCGTVNPRQRITNSKAQRQQARAYDTHAAARNASIRCHEAVMRAHELR